VLKKEKIDEKRVNPGNPRRWKRRREKRREG